MDRALALKRTPRGLLVRADIASAQGDAALTRQLINQAYWMAPDNSEILARQLEQYSQSSPAPEPGFIKR